MAEKIISSKILYRALSGFKADFGPLLGTSNSPARDASENMKMDVYNLVDTLKRYELLGNIIFFGCYCPICFES